MSPPTSTTGPRHRPTTSCAGYGPTTRTPSIRRAKNNVVEDDELERSIKDRLQESFINSFPSVARTSIGESTVIDYRLMWNKSSEETPNQVTSAFIQEDVEFDPNVSADCINPNNIQANPLNEDRRRVLVR